MFLYLHIGTEKTASSFLQAVAAKNRNWLQEQGIYFPHAGKREKMMQTGKISPGNGRDLYEMLKQEKYKEVLFLLRNYQTDAKNQRCEKVLISNENLLELLSDPEIARSFLATLRKTGMKLAPFLLVLRDPVDQALSLYKHRSKNGNLDNLEQWLVTGYHLPFHLQGLFGWVEQQHGPGLYVSRYRPNSAWLVSEFFEKWLGLASLPVWADKSVNPSLTLSELFLIREIRKSRPAWVSFLYDSLLEVPKESKSDDRYLKTGFLSIIRGHLGQYRSVWQEANKRLPHPDKFSIPEMQGNGAEKNTTLSFTPEQMTALTNFWFRTRSPRFIFQVFWRCHLRPRLANVKREMLNLLRNYIK